MLQAFMHWLIFKVRATQGTSGVMGLGISDRLPVPECRGRCTSIIKKCLLVELGQQSNPGKALLMV